MAALLLMEGVSIGQSSNFSNSNTDWLKTRNELILSGGAMNFLGDLGGLDQEGTDYSIVDLEIPMTAFTAYVGFRHRLKKTLSWRGQFTYGKIQGDDNLTAEQFRNYRNLHFKSNVFELANMLEFGWSIDKAGHRYEIPGAKGFKSTSYYIFVYGGIGALYFNPKAQYNGSWVALQPLGTEGQVVDPEQKKYSRVTYTIPLGIGGRVLVGRKITLGFDLCYRIVGSDYLDDVSTDYYNNDIIRAQQGDVAADLADPSSGDNWNWTIHGEQRGDPETKDAIVNANITVGYNLVSYGRRGAKASLGSSGWQRKQRKRKGIKNKSRKRF